MLVPTLVEKPSGEVVYGLSAKDFTLEDNGVKQNIHVDDDLDMQPVSLVVCIQRGRSSGLEFDKLAKLGPLLDLLPRADAAKLRWWSSIRSQFTLMPFRAIRTTSQKTCSVCAQEMAAQQSSMPSAIQSICWSIGRRITAACCC